MKKTLSFLLSVLIILSTFSIVTASAKDTNVEPGGEYYSDIEDNRTWSFDEKTGTLTILENDESYYKVPWSCYLSEITSVVIQNGVTKINSSAFANCTNLTNVIIPNSVIEIADRAFDCCMSLESITIPNSVTDIGYFVFEDCVSLAKIKLSNNIKSIKEDTFINTRYYNDINNWENNVLYLDDCLIGAKDACTNCVIKDGTRIIADSVFYEHKNLLSVTIPNSVTNIGEHAFEGCVDLKDIMISAGIENIGRDAFSNTGYFREDENWVENQLYLGDYLLCVTDECKSCVIEDGTKIIANSAFTENANLTNVLIPDSVVAIGDGAFSACTGLKSVTIPNGVISVGNYAFGDCISLINITISGNVNKLGNYAFSNCEDLTRVKINDHINILGDYAFENCISLTTIIGLDGVTRIGDYTFFNCRNLKSITIPNSVTVIGDSAFDYCESLSSITILDGVTKIGEYAFSNCTNLTSIVIPNSVTDISEGVFNSCTSLTNVTIPNNLSIIYDDTFNSCKSLTNMTIPNNVTKIGEHSFANCTNLKSITIPKSVTEIDYEAFIGCQKLQNIYYTGTKQQWKAISIVFDNEELLDANIIFNYDPTCSKITKVTLSKKSVTLVRGRATTLKATIIPTNATNKKLKWTTSNSKVATVSQSGKITAKGKGTATIKAITLDGTQKYAICKVTVKQPVTSVKLNKKSVTLKVKGKVRQKSYTLKATVSPRNADNKSVKWTTSNSKIAIVSQNGKVTAKKKGSCYITATAKDGSKKYAKCKIVVK